MLTAKLWKEMAEAYDLAIQTSEPVTLRGIRAANNGICSLLWLLQYLNEIDFSTEVKATMMLPMRRFGWSERSVPVFSWRYTDLVSRRDYCLTQAEKVST